jgi:hypothetical protein
VGDVRILFAEEMSMMDEYDWFRLFHLAGLLPRLECMVLIGDENQIPPILGGDPLRDIRLYLETLARKTCPKPTTTQHFETAANVSFGSAGFRLTENFRVSSTCPGAGLLIQWVRDIAARKRFEIQQAMCELQRLRVLHLKQYDARGLVREFVQPHLVDSHRSHVICFTHQVRKELMNQSRQILFPDLTGDENTEDKVNDWQPLMKLQMTQSVRHAFGELNQLQVVVVQSIFQVSGRHSQIMRAYKYLRRLERRSKRQQWSQHDEEKRQQQQQQQQQQDMSEEQLRLQNFFHVTPPCVLPWF